MNFDFDPSNRIMHIKQAISGIMERIPWMKPNTEEKRRGELMFPKSENMPLQILSQRKLIKPMLYASVQRMDIF